MSRARLIPNLVVGAGAGCLWNPAYSVVLASTPIWPSSFMLASCRNETVGSVSASCRVTNYLGLFLYDVLHFIVVAMLLGIVLAGIQKLLERGGFPYRYSIVATGFLAGWIATMFSSGGILPAAWFFLANWLTQIATFFGVYFWIGKYIMAFESPSLSFKPTH